MPLAILRADAGPNIGIGHVMRCLTLADELRARGYHCRLATAVDGLAALPAGVAAAEPLALDPAAAPSAQAAAIGRAIGHADLLVVDHFDLDIEFETAARAWCRATLVVDDLANRRHDCDLLVDPSLGHGAADYRARVPAPCRLLLGPRYAPLRRRFADARDKCLPRPRRSARRLLVTLGGTDPKRFVLTALDAVAAAGLDLAVDVVLPRAAAHYEAVVARARSFAGRVAVHGAVANPVDLMIAADLCIGAGGTTVWERACLGLPTILLPAAENQRGNIADLARAGAALAIAEPVTAAAIAAPLATLARDADRLARMSEAAAALCDGRGAERIADAVGTALPLPERAQ
jgi:UDP-2,4-diacetamido-2,4,6-trideoxy-beta-L-altropyranose hydrolase